MHSAPIKWMRMTDQASISRNDAFLFRLEDALQMACLSRYIDVEYLSDDAPLLSILPDTYSHCVLSQFSLYHTSRFSVAFSQVLVREGRECYAELLYSSLHTSLEIVISSGKVKQRTAPPALRNSLTGDTQTSYPQRSRMRPTRGGHAGITMTLPTTTEFAQKVSAFSDMAFLSGCLELPLTCSVWKASFFVH